MSFEIDPVFGCHLATGRRDKDGYAFHGRTRAHIASYTEHVGPIDEGLVVDHLCRRRHCIAPHHLEAVSQRENLLRKSWHYVARKKTCPKGHAWTMTGMITPEGGRVCRACNREARRAA